jgi:hypothetical protein
MKTFHFEDMASRDGENVFPKYSFLLCEDWKTEEYFACQKFEISSTALLTACLYQQNNCMPGFVSQRKD